MTALKFKADRPDGASYAAAAWLLMCEARALRAVAQVESGPEGAFLESGEPVILFERHLFSRLTKGEFDGVHLAGEPGEHAVLSSPIPGGYGPMSIQHRKLAEASALDRAAALRACSWGLYQILGENHVAAGFPILQRFVNAMYRSADDHLRALVMFIRHDERLVDALRARNWTSFARIYNGPAFARSHYDTRIADAYAVLA